MTLVRQMRMSGRGVLFAVMLTATGAFAQDGRGWPRADAPSPIQEAQQEEPATPYTTPATLTVKAGAFITVRLNQTLSSDENQPGDAFSATLVQPVVVDGIVVAQRGQIAGGRVVEARKAGRIEGVSRLAVQLTDLTFVDGQQAAIQSQLVGQRGPASVGRDAAAIGTTTAMGAMIGAAADWGVGAAIGAGLGAAAGAIGVLSTRGHPTIIDSESILTFRLESPVSVSTERAPQAFRLVDPNDYERTYNAQLRERPRRRDCAGYRCAPPPWFYYPGYYYGPYWGPYYWGPSFSVFYGRAIYRHYPRWR
jgi:hypothetical protein